MAALELPTSFPVKVKSFRLIHKQQVTAAGAGFVQTIDRANPMWVCEYQTSPISNTTTYGAMIAFLESLEGSMNTFLGYDPKRPKPLDNVLNQSAAPTGVTVTALDWTNSQITLAGMGSNTLNIGDYISYQFGNIWRLYKVTTQRVGNGVVTVKPRPIVHTGLPLAARLNRPCAEFKMMGDYTEEDTVDSYPILRFAGYQFVNRA